MTTESDSTTWLASLQIYLNNINQVFIVAISVYTTFMCVYIGPTAFSLHTWLSTIGVLYLSLVIDSIPLNRVIHNSKPKQYQLLMAESIMCFYEHNSWTKHHGRRTRSNLHWILQVIGCSFAIAGSWILYDARRVHFISIHSVTGMVSLVFSVVGMLNGIWAHWATEWRAHAKPVYGKLFHNVTGLFTFIVGMWSLVYGYELFPFERYSPRSVQIAAQIAATLTIVLSLFGAGPSLWSQTKAVWPQRWALRTNRRGTTI